ncbi:hypothetical protein ATETN484_0005005200 [Aspergillus terreus]|nr:hypothetical protein ATETN484_0005005200 [Aspergillus terreus]
MEDRYLYRYIHFKTRASAAEKDITSLKNWFYNHDGAIMPEERTYIDKNDLFALVPKDRSPLRRFFERSSHFRLFKLWRQKPQSSDLPLHIRQHIHYSSDSRIDQFVTLTIVATGLVMLIAPIWILAFTRPVVLKLAVITIFILLFLALVALGTNAKPYESLAATAAYATRVGLLTDHLAVEDVALIGVERDGTEALASRKSKLSGVSAEQEASNIAEWLSGKVAYHKKLREGVHFIDQIPKSATGKVLRRVLKEQAKKEATSKAKL